MGDAMISQNASRCFTTIFMAAAIIVSCVQYAMARNIMIHGAGISKCYSLINDSGDYSDDGILKHIAYMSWVEGYITSFNSHNNINITNVAEGFSIGAVLEWIEAYCRNNLDTTMVGATNAFIRSHIK